MNFINAWDKCKEKKTFASASKSPHPAPSAHLPLYSQISEKGKD